MTTTALPSAQAFHLRIHEGVFAVPTDASFSVKIDSSTLRRERRDGTLDITITVDGSSRNSITRDESS